MKRILITAFGNYSNWDQNSSWLTLVELTKALPRNLQVVTRRYPVDLIQARDQLSHDLQHQFDFAIHLGQAPGSAGITLEQVALNTYQDEPGGAAQRLVPDGPVAYATRLPLETWRSGLTEAGIPSSVSYHAGTYLCNAVYYLNRHFCQQRSLATEAVFVHVPLTPHQTVQLSLPQPSLPAERSAEAVTMILNGMTSLRASSQLV